MYSPNKTRNIPLHTLHFVLLPDKTKALLQLWRHCHKRLKPTPQLAMSASVLLLLALKHCKAWSSSSMNDLDSFFDINLDSFFDINEWEWSSSWPLNNLYCPIKTHAKGHRKEKTRESRHSYIAKAKKPLAKPLISQENNTKCLICHPYKSKVG